MRGITRRWLLAAADAPDDTLAALSLPPLVRRFLAARGHRDAASVDRFCTPRLSDLRDPAHLPGVEAAAERLVAAVRGGKHIVIYGDYDVDGVTATAILYHVIRAVAPDARLATYVPHRLAEGYGLNASALEQLAADGCDLVVTVDCGISAVEPVRAARAAGLDVIVTDHHHLPLDPAGTVNRGALPDALLVHPRLDGADVPEAELCGAGVAFKLAWAFATAWTGGPRVGAELQRTLLDMLPLVALGTIADVVPLRGENRVLARYGLELIKRTPIAGLRALLEAADLADEHIDCQKVGYVLAPRLNACGRMGHAAEAVRLLTDAGPDEAATIAAQLTRLNADRRRTERAILEQAIAAAEAAGMTSDDRRAIVLAHPEWHPGVVGIVCSRLTERYGRPAVLLQRGETMCRGSARGVDGYSIHAGLVECASHLETFGGHDAAAGLALAPENLDAFASALIEHANERIAVERLTPALRVDCDASLHELDTTTVGQLRGLYPFGRGNRAPVLRLSGVTIDAAPQPMGGQGRHLALRLREDRGGRRRALRAVWWSQGARAEALAVGQRVAVVIEPKINTYRGRVSVECEIRDVCVEEQGGVAPERPVAVTG